MKLVEKISCDFLCIFYKSADELTSFSVGLLHNTHLLINIDMNSNKDPLNASYLEWVHVVVKVADAIPCFYTIYLTNRFDCVF